MAEEENKETAEAESKEKDKTDQADENQENNDEQDEAASDKEIDDNDEEGVELAAAAKKKKIIIIAAAILAILIIAISSYLFLNPAENAEEQKTAETEAVESEEEKQLKIDEEKIVRNANSKFFELEEFIVNLVSDEKAPSFLKIVIVLEMDKNINIEEVASNLSIIRDNTNIFLRELRPSDLKGAGGLLKIKNELIYRYNKILEPIAVKDVLFKTILIN